MTFDMYRQSVGARLSEVKLTILRTLWDAGTTFPRNWVASSRLLELTNQKYFDRRTRELRDENGCDIETRHIGGEHQYRLVSPSVKVSNPRAYLSESEKAALFRTDKNTCQVCGKIVAPGVRGLQADHKIPLARNGSHARENWQSLCNECNVAKRRACQGCSIDCKTCQWAFPAQVGIPLTIRLDPSVFDELKTKMGSEPLWLSKLIEQNLRKS